jgi:hypothetical protein
LITEGLGVFLADVDGGEIAPMVNRVVAVNALKLLAQWKKAAARG